MLVDIPTLCADRLSAKQLSNFAATSTPVIVKGLRMPHIDLLAILQLEASNKTVSVAPLQANKTDKWLEQMRDWVAGPVETDAVVLAVSGRRVRISLSDFIANIDHFYADGAGNGSKSWKFLADYIGRRCDLGRIDAMLDGPLERHIWLGPSSTVSRLHYDAVDTLFCQVEGRKKFKILPPEKFDFLVPQDSTPLLKSYYDWDGSSLSGLKFTRGEISREVVWNYSRFDIDDGCDVELNPGDTFFLPAYWWHQVEALPYDDERPWCLSYSQVYRSPFVRSKATSTTRPSSVLKRVYGRFP